MITNTSTLQTRRSLTTLTKLTFAVLVINTLAYASEFILLGQLDREISIVVAVLLAGSILVSTGWRWTPALAALLAGGIMLGNPFLLHNLSLPVTSGFFLAAATQGVCSLIILVAGITATIQNYRINKRVL
jgi:hypothetical protein